MLKFKWGLSVKLGVTFMKIMWGLTVKVGVDFVRWGLIPPPHETMILELQPINSTLEFICKRAYVLIYAFAVYKFVNINFVNVNMRIFFLIFF